jgi:flagellar basal-body rod protein FlgG
MPTNTITQILHVSRSGMLARLANLDNVSNNLANVNTAGFKATRLNFQETLSKAVLGGVATETTQHLLTEGSFRQSSEPLNMVIDGDGYFAVRLPDGRTAYTRDGSFQRDAAGHIVSADGYLLNWTGQLPATFEELQVVPDGSGTVRVRQGNAWTNVGTIPLTHFINPDGLQGLGQNLWLETAISGAPQTGAAGTATPGGVRLGKILGNMTENSNVNMADEMTQTILLERAYSMSVRAFQQTDQMFGLANQMRR